jgi:hypothetical protein
MRMFGVDRFGTLLFFLLFAWIYLAMGSLFDGPVLDPNVASLPTYYSFVVLTTLVARLVSMYGSPMRTE